VITGEEIIVADRIEITKENLSVLYGRFKRNPCPPKPPTRQHGQHGGNLKRAMDTAISEIQGARKVCGIDTDNLMVLELLSNAMPATSLDRLLGMCNLWIVEEVKIPNTDNSKLVVQFEDRAALATFEYERALYMQESTEKGAMTPAQRIALFDCIDNIRKMEREDRIGRRLKKYISAGNRFSDGFFTVNIDIWYNGERSKVLQIEAQIKSALGTGGSRLLGDLFELQNLLLGRAKVNEFSLNALLDLDIIATIDFPMETSMQDYSELYSQDFTPVVHNELDDNAPLAAVIDSGVFSGNPLLSAIIVGEEDFDLTEDTASDLNGHGTGVAGIVAYGGFSQIHSGNSVFKPLVRICNGKVMHNDARGNPVYSLEKRPEQIVKEAIEYFYEHYHCRVFNLSSGDSDYVYAGGRQMTWAGMIDQLARDLDIVIIVSAGNQYPELPDFSDRDDLCKKVRDQLLNPEYRLIDPATSALAISVGSITRNATPYIGVGITALAVGDVGTMSAFTRTGKGVNNAVKPEFVDYGGNFSVYQKIRGRSAWREKDRNLMEPTINHTTEKVFRGFSGTSFAAPHVTHYAARLERSLEAQLQEAPSANLIRAMLASAADYPLTLRTWAENAVDGNYTGAKAQRAENRLRLIGYGKIDEEVLFSNSTDPKHVTLFAEDELPLRSLHLYKIPVPTKFVKVKGTKRISIGFAYNPPVKMSRKEYIANSLFVEVFRRTDADNLLSFVQKKEQGAEEDADTILENFRQQFGASFEPGSTTIQNSTLQQRVWEKSAKGGGDLLWNDNDPYIYVLITGKERFTHAEKEIPQPYAIAITFSYDAKEDIQLHQKLIENVSIRNRVAERIRIRERVQN